MLKIIGYFIIFVLIITLSIFLNTILGRVNFSFSTVSFELPTILLIWANILFLSCIYIIYKLLKAFNFIVKIPMANYKAVTSNYNDTQLKHIICDLALGNTVNSKAICKKLSANSSELSQVLQALALFHEQEYDKAYEILNKISIQSKSTLDHFKRICFYKSSLNTDKKTELSYFLTKNNMPKLISDIVHEELLQAHNKTDLVNFYNKTNNINAYNQTQLEISKDLMDQNEISKAFKIVEKIIHEDPTNIQAVQIFTDFCIRNDQLKKAFKTIKNSWAVQPNHHLAHLFLSTFKDDKKNVIHYLNTLIQTTQDAPESIILKAKLGLALKIWSISNESLQLTPNRTLTTEEHLQIKIMQADLLEHKDHNQKQANSKRLEIIQTLPHL